MYVLTQKDKLEFALTIRNYKKSSKGWLKLVKLIWYLKNFAMMKFSSNRLLFEFISQTIILEINLKHCSVLPELWKAYTLFATLIISKEIFWNEFPSLPLCLHFSLSTSLWLIFLNVNLCLFLFQSICFQCRDRICPPLMGDSELYLCHKSCTWDTQLSGI